jgi:periplasmic protein TonB
MKTEHGVSKSWDDLVFENKNKEYGAYTVRRSYSQNLTTGLGISVCFACMILITPKVMSLIFPGQTLLPDIEIPVDVPVTKLSQPPVLEMPETPPPPQASRQQNNLPPAVTTEETTDVIPTVEDINASLDNVTPGEGTVPGPTEPVVVEAPPAPVEPTVFINAEVMPAYENGLQRMYRDISRSLKYPRVAQRNGTEGTVFVTFVISKEGKVTNVSILKGISEECDKEAMRVISLLDKWTPGSQNHRAVNVRMTIPIKFELAE